MTPSRRKRLFEAVLEGLANQFICKIENTDTTSICRIAARWKLQEGLGIRIDLNLIPNEQEVTKAADILFSFNPGTILIVAKKAHAEQLQQIFDKWELPYQQIGKITDTEQVEFFWEQQKLAAIPFRNLMPGAFRPATKKQTTRPSYLKKARQFRLSKLSKPKKGMKTAKKLFSSLNIVSRRSTYEQFDSTIGSNTLDFSKPSNAALLRIKGNAPMLALSVVSNTAYVQVDPFVGTMIAVAEAAGNIVCSGAKPLAMAACFNFDSLEDPDTYWQFKNAIRGLSEASRKLDIPITSGTLHKAKPTKKSSDVLSHPLTPVIGMIGTIENQELITTMDFKSVSDRIYMIGTPQNDVGSSEYLNVIHKIALSPAPKFDLDEALHIQKNLRKLIKKGLIKSAHNISRGGLFVALLESAISGNLGFTLETDQNFRKDAYLFGESQNRIVVTVEEGNEDKMVNYLNSRNVPFSSLGEVVEDKIVIDNEDYGTLEEWKNIYEQQLQQKIEEFD